MSGAWRKQQTRDTYFRKSKAEGYRARSAYKLIEINAKYQLIRPGATVLDLGASPGSWSQVAAGLVGPNGRVVAVDIQPMDPLPFVEVIQGDITRPDVVADIELAVPGGADAVISDVSPQISGIAPTDHARSVELALASLHVARRCLRSGGAFVVKVFHGEDFDRFVAEARPHFQKVHIFRPPASRKESREHYVVGLGFLPPTSPRSAR